MRSARLEWKLLVAWVVVVFVTALLIISWPNRRSTSKHPNTYCINLKKDFYDKGKISAKYYLDRCEP